MISTAHLSKKLMPQRFFRPEHAAASVSLPPYCRYRLIQLDSRAICDIGFSRRARHQCLMPPLISENELAAGQLRPQTPTSRWPRRQNLKHTKMGQTPVMLVNDLKQHEPEDDSRPVGDSGRFRCRCEDYLSRRCPMIFEPALHQGSPAPRPSPLSRFFGCRRGIRPNAPGRPGADSTSLSETRPSDWHTRPIPRTTRRD